MTNFWNKYQDKTLLLLFFIILSLSLLAPIASNLILPDGDYAAHLNMIWQAKAAIKEWQFPIRVAPTIRHGWDYPLFQFYSPLPYMVSAILYFLIPFNVWIVYKLTIILALVLAGIYAFRLSYFLTNSKTVSLLMSSIYLFSPYLIINLDIRGDFTECIAQCILPVAIYYGLKVYYDKLNANRFLLAAIAWFSLATTHLITFAYTALFFMLLLFFCTLQKTRGWKSLFETGIPIVYGTLLASWYLAPVAIIKSLHVYKELFNPTTYNFLTPLAGLLATTSVSPMPLPGNGFLGAPLYPAIGWPIILAIGTGIYALSKKSIKTGEKIDNLIVPLLLIFPLALLITWSPIDFWKFVPQFLNFAQFSYRYLTQIMWIGSIIVAWAILWNFGNKLETKHTIIGLILIILISHSWIQTQKSNPVYLNPRMIKDFDSKDDYGIHAYNITTELEQLSSIRGLKNIPLVTGDKWLMINTPLTIPSFIVNPDLVLTIKGNIPEKRFNKPFNLFAKIDNKIIASKKVSTGNFEWKIPFYQPAILNTIAKNPNFKLEFLADKSFLEDNKTVPSYDGRPLTAGNVDISFSGLDNVKHLYSEMPVTKTQETCTKKRFKTLCKFTTTASTTLVQLPLYYYPALINININGKQTKYYSSLYRNTLMTSLILPPGEYNVTAYFEGYKWANWISLLSWLSLLLIALLNLRKSTPAL